MNSDTSFFNDVRALGDIVLSLSLPERLELIKSRLGNPHTYMSADNIKVKINYTGNISADDVFFEHFTKNRKFPK
jgi:hypothetical protein